ncbi:hypothetical protein JCM33374_g145 [Metschnikowia sp. JCM 33374]|nr:hypothetical protein JCM33374_g145 [Metschnikowia sp. JCM 33374]
MKLLPPANGKRLWRVKRPVMTGGEGYQKPDRSGEGLQNSLRVSSVGKQFHVKRSPIKRPRNKGGKNKFIFVDLSPMKSNDYNVSKTTTTHEGTTGTSPCQETISSISTSDECVSSTSSIDEDILQEKSALYEMQTSMFNERTFLGLGLMNVNYSYQNPIKNSSLISQNARHFPGEIAPQPQKQKQQQQPSPPHCNENEAYWLPTDYDRPGCSWDAHRLRSPFEARVATHRRSQFTSAIPISHSADNLEIKKSDSKVPISTDIYIVTPQPKQRCTSAASTMNATQFKDVTTPKLQCINTSDLPTVPGFEYFQQITSHDYSSLGQYLGFDFNPIVDFTNTENLNSFFDAFNADMNSNLEKNRFEGFF